MLTPERELGFHKFVDGLSLDLRHMQRPGKALQHALVRARRFFRAKDGCIAALAPGRTAAELLFAIPKERTWDLDLLTRFILHQRPAAPGDMLVAPLRRRGGGWGVMALMCQRGSSDQHDSEMLGRVAAVVSDAVQRMDQERILGVRDRIDRKVMDHIDPKDLFYEILDGLRSLTSYDHSSAVLIRDEADAALRLVAEQIAWTKAGSERIGLRLALTDDVEAMLQAECVYGFDRRADNWREWSGRPVAPLARLLDYNRTEGAGRDECPEGSILCAPLLTRDGLVGVLKVAACQPGTLRPHDASLVERFRSQAAVAIQNLRRTESLRARVLRAERKHAMAELARTVSHDVNNALGSMLPLIQQAQEDLRQGRVNPSVLSADLEQVQKSLQVCRRIFGGMLSFARGSARRGRTGQVGPAVDTALAVLKDGIDRRGIGLRIDVPLEVPAVVCGQNELEQVLLNLLMNARDATGRGGTIAVTVRAMPGAVGVSVADNGCGISPDHLSKVLEPFFTTKSHGNGLGLPICRSILWEIGGTLELQSDLGRGTQVDVTLPRVT
jgi:two-component system, NtrC family, sensor kinase